MVRDVLTTLLLISTVNASIILPKCPLRGSIKFSNPSDHQQYFLCENGELISKRCSHKKLFDKYRSDCVQFVSNSSEQFTDLGNSEIIDKELIADEPPFKCPDNEVNNYPYPSDCQKYYHCANSNYTILTCRRLFLFDAKTRVCQLFTVAYCYNYTTTTDPSPVYSTVAAICPPNKVENLPYPGNCHKYYHCDYGVQEIRKCSWFQLFDTIKLECRFRLFATCDSRTVQHYSDYNRNEITNIEHYLTNKEDSSQYDSVNQVVMQEDNMQERPSQENRTTVQEEEFTCARDGVYNYVYPGSCHKYYHCNNKTLSTEKCWFFENFDPVKLTCRFVCFVNCHSTPDPTPSPQPSTVVTVYIVTEETEPPIPTLPHPTTHHNVTQK